MLLARLPSAGHIASVASRHSTRVYAPLLMTAAANVVRRRITTAGGAPVNTDKLNSKGTKEPLHQGVEGPHISRHTAFCYVARAETTVTVPVGDLLPPPSTTQQINGDWVLFHPVYSPEELKAVEVSDGDPT